MTTVNWKSCSNKGRGIFILGKGKPRRDPNKPQNKYGSTCHLYNKECGGWCEFHIGDTKVCKGNRHNCVKTIYRRAASRSDKRKLHDMES